MSGNADGKDLVRQARVVAAWFLLVVGTLNLAANLLVVVLGKVDVWDSWLKLLISAFFGVTFVVAGRSLLRQSKSG